MLRDGMLMREQLPVDADEAVVWPDEAFYLKEFLDRPDQYAGGPGRQDGEEG